jgi:DNA-binding transcriptional MocR family regulator
MAAALEGDSEPSLDVRVSPGGFYIWCGISGGVEQSALMANAIARGVNFLPGRTCFEADPPENAIRINFTHCSETDIDVGIERLLEAVRVTAAMAPRPNADGGSTAPVV